MKRILLLVLTTNLFFVIHSSSLFAQLTSADSVHFTAILDGAFELVVEYGSDQTAWFQSADDYNNGVAEDVGVPGLDPGYSTVSMQATGNWFLQIRGENFIPTSGGATGSIPINNVGVWCEAIGVHQFGVEVASSYTSANAALGIQTTDLHLIDLATGNSNAGSPDDNRFTLHWLMGTMQGSMNPVSMFTQLANGVFSKGTFTSEIVLTMTEIP